MYLYLACWPCRSPTGFLWFFNARCQIWIKPHTSMPLLWGTRAPWNRTGILDADQCERQQNKIWNARMTRTNRMTRMSRMSRMNWVFVCIDWGLILEPCDIVWHCAARCKPIPRGSVHSALTDPTAKRNRSIQSLPIWGWETLAM